MLNVILTMNLQRILQLYLIQKRVSHLKQGRWSVICRHSKDEEISTFHHPYCHKALLICIKSCSLSLTFPVHINSKACFFFAIPTIVITISGNFYLVNPVWIRETRRKASVITKYVDLRWYLLMQIFSLQNYKTGVRPDNFKNLFQPLNSMILWLKALSFMGQGWDEDNDVGTIKRHHNKFVPCLTANRE